MKSIITEIKRLDQAATKGPWEADNWDTTVQTEEQIVCVSTTSNRENDTPLIALYRNSTPALAEAYEKLMEVAERMAGQLKVVSTLTQGNATIDSTLAAFNALKSGAPVGAQ